MSDDKRDYSGYVALTEIRHGNEDGSLSVFEVNDSVSELDSDTLDTLFASGSIGEPPPQVKDLADANAHLQAEIATLQAALAAAQLPANLNAPAGSGAQVMTDNDSAKADAATAAAQQNVADDNKSQVDVSKVANTPSNPPAK